MTPNRARTGTEAHRGTAAAQTAARVADLEARLGDPLDPGNPVGCQALLTADEDATLSLEGELLLDGFDLNSEFVPRALGGRLDRVDTLVRTLRPVFRRDAALGLGYGVTSFVGAADLWLAGSAGQQRRAADVLLQGGRIAYAHRELAHGNDCVREEFQAHRTTSGFLVRGTKPLMCNAAQARLLVVHARTAADPAPGSRSHSVLLLDRDRIDPGTSTLLPGPPMARARAVPVGGLRLDDCLLPPDALVGAWGAGVAHSLRSLALVRSSVPAMVLGLVDTGLRIAVTTTSAATAPALGRVEELLVAAFTDLLICDSLALVAARSVNLLPGQSSVYAAASAYLLPKILSEVMGDLSAALGDRLQDTGGLAGIFHKHARDLPLTGLGHAGSAACLATLLPQLPHLARRSRYACDPADRKSTRLNSSHYALSRMPSSA